MRTQVAGVGLEKDLEAVIKNETTLAILVEYTKQPDERIIVSVVRKKNTQVFDHTILKPEDKDFNKLTKWFKVGVRA
jgi:hypothetical protein